MNENENISTRVFFDSFRSFQPNDFLNLGYILKWVNHSIWFGLGSLHTKIESLWSQIKNITNNFSGLAVESLKKTFNKIEITDYMDGWLCFVY